MKKNKIDMKQLDQLIKELENNFEINKINKNNLLYQIKSERFLMNIYTNATFFIQKGEYIFIKDILEKYILKEKMKYNNKKNNYDAYIDGSYKDMKVSYGLIILKNRNPITEFYGRLINKEFIRYRNVYGEIFALLLALKWALKNNIRNINIYYDYKGIESWITGDWQTKNDLTKLYKYYYEKFYKNKIIVTFIKVKSHSGDYYNEKVDLLAKKGIESKNYSEFENEFFESLKTLKLNQSYY